MARCDFIAYGVEHNIVSSTFYWGDDSENYPSPPPGAYNVRYNSSTQRYEYSDGTTIVFQSPNTYPSNTPENLKAALDTEWVPVSVNTWNTVKWVKGVNYCLPLGSGDINLAVLWNLYGEATLTWEQVKALPNVVLEAESNITIPSSETTITCLRMIAIASSSWSIGGNYDVTINADIVNNRTASNPAILFPSTYSSKLTINCPSGSGLYSGGRIGSTRAISFNKTGSVEINGNLYSVAGGSYASEAMATYSGAVVINGNLYGGGTHCFYQVGGTLAITGNVYASKTTSGRRGLSKDGGQLTINGNVYGGGSSGHSSNIGVLDAYGNTTINGNVYGGSGTGTYAYGYYVAPGAVQSANINGNVYGGTSDANYGVFVGSANAVSVFINGDIRAGTGSGCYGLVVNQAAPKIYVNGDIYANKTSGNVLVNGFRNTQASGRHFHKYLGRYFDRNGVEELSGGKPSPTEAINSLSGIGRDWLITGEVDSVSDLDAIRAANLVFGNFVQTANITLSGNISPLLTNFAGSYSGYDYKSKQAYRIVGFENDGESSDFGFFSGLASTGVLRYIGLANVNVYSGANRAALVGGSCNGTVEYCYAWRQSGNGLPALVANLTSSGKLKQCYSNTKLCLSNSGGTIVQCYHNTYGDTNGTYISNMKDKTLYVGWNFTTTWGIDPAFNSGYPYLAMNPALTGVGGKLLGANRNRGASSVEGLGAFIGMGML